MAKRRHTAVMGLALALCAFIMPGSMREPHVATGAMAGMVTGTAMIAAASGATAVLARQSPHGAAEEPDAAAPVEAAPATPEAVDALLATMDDDETRLLLQQRLKAEAQANQARAAGGKPFTQMLVEASATARGRLFAIKTHWGDMLTALRTALGVMAKGEGGVALGVAALGALLIALLGWSAERLFTRRAGSLRRRSREGEAAGEAPSRARLLMGDAFITGTGLLLFGVVVFTLFSIVYGEETPGHLLAAHILLFFLAYRPATAVTAFVLRPQAPALRLAPLSDAASRGLTNFLVVLLALTLCAKFLVDLFQAAGAPEYAVITLCLAVAAPVLLFLVVSVLSHTQDVAGAILAGSHGEPTPLRRQLASLWPAVALLYLGFITVIWCVILFLHGPDGPQGLLLMSLAVIPLYLALDRVVTRILDSIFGLLVERPPKPISMVREDDDVQSPFASAARMPEPPAEASLEGTPEAPPEATPAPDETEESPPPDSHPWYAPTRRACRAALFGFVGVVLLWVWRAPLPMTEDVIEHGVKILGTLFVATALWSLVRGAIRRKFNDAGAQEQPNPRLRTLLPLIQKVLGAFFLVTTALMVVSQLGVNIGPLLAGAGVLGLAVGLGSQTLVKDVVAGVFFLMDDAFRVGDYIKLGATEGYVIKMSVRTINLEHYLGYVQIIPYGDIKDVINFSRNPISIKLKIPMPLETDPKKFKKIVRKINNAMMEDPEFKDDLVQPVKSQGVKRIEDSVMVFGVKFMARPGTQFGIRKEVYARLYKELKKAGLTFAAPGVTVYTARQDAQDAAARQEAQAPPEPHGAVSPTPPAPPAPSTFEGEASPSSQVAAGFSHPNDIPEGAAAAAAAALQRRKAEQAARSPQDGA